MIIDHMFPDHEAFSADSANTIFGRLFGIPWNISNRKLFIRRVTKYEILSIYSIPVSNDNYVISSQYEILYDLLPFIISCTFRSDIM